MSISEDGMLVSEDLSETSYYNENILEDILDDNILEESEAEVNADYPNEAYADLMTLVTKHNISNKTGDAIIKFFNKHANLNTSPLLKSIMQGRNYMDNMNIPTLTFTKTCIINYNNNEYYLHHRSLINCIKNILSIPDMSQNFALTFKKLEICNHIYLCNLYYIYYLLNTVLFNIIIIYHFYKSFFFYVYTRMYINFFAYVFIYFSYEQNKIK